MSFLDELKRRKVFRLAIAYVVVAWVIIQVVTAIEEPLSLPGWFDTTVIVLLAVGFPFAVMFSWAYDVTEDGIVRDGSGGHAPSALQIDYGKIALVAVLILGAFLGGNYVTTQSGSSTVNVGISPNGAVQRFHIPVDDSASVYRDRDAWSAITPDGLTIVALGWFDGKAMLMSRGVEDLRFRRIPGTENSRFEFALAPDGRRIVFQDEVGRKLKTIAIGGGTAVSIANLGEGAPIRAITWGSDGTIVFGRYDDPALYRIAETGGTPEMFARPEDDLAFKHPRFIPDSDILALAIGEMGQSASHADRLAFLRPDGDLVVTDIEGASPIAVSGNRIVYFSNNSLFATTYDSTSLSVGREVVALGSDVLYFFKAYFDVSQQGSLIYQTDWRLEPSSLVWVDRSGSREPLDVEPGSYETPRLSPDGQKIAVIRRSSYGPDIVILAADGRLLFQLTDEDSLEQFPVWSPDSRLLYFSQERIDQLYRTEVYQGAVPERLTALPYRNETGSISPDGQELFFIARRDPANPDLAVLDTDSASIRFLSETDYPDVDPAISPDGRWLAYESGRAGIPEIWIRPYPDIQRDAWQIFAGGRAPTWGDDSSELFFWSEDESQILRVRIETDPEFRFSDAESLFDSGTLKMSGTGYYHRFNRKFLLSTRRFENNRSRRELIIVQNWPALLLK